MKKLRRLPIVLFALSLAYTCFAQQKPRFEVVNASSKELKRTAHRLRIPVEQLKNAREALKEATDLIRKTDPYPMKQLFNLVQMWTQLDRSRSKEVIDSFINDLRSKAAKCTDLGQYQSITSIGLSLIQQNSTASPEKALQLIRDWPEPNIAASDQLKSFRDGLESQMKNQVLSQLANSDPEKALSLLPQPGDSGSYPYSIASQVAMNLMNSGKKDAALRLADQVIGSFDPNASKENPDLMNYQYFVQTVGRIDAGRANSALGGLVTALMNQPDSDNCGYLGIKTGGTSITLTCSETRMFNLVQNSRSSPTFAMKALDSMPGLKSKLEGIGGIDGLWGSNSLNMSYYSGKNQQGTVSSGGGTFVNPYNLIQELKGKDASTIKSKLKDKTVDELISLAMNAAYQDPDFGATVLEMAEPLIPQVEPLQKRATVLQNFIQAHRQVEGESDPEMLKTGFVIADQLRQEQAEKEETQKSNPLIIVGGVRNFGISQPDQLEAFLVAELSRDNYESAMRYARSVESNNAKLQCLILIAQALSNSNY